MLFSFTRMANKMLFSNRNFIHRPPMTGPGLVENRPHQRNPKALGGNRQHQNVHLVPPDLPVGPVQAQDPRRLELQELDHGQRQPVSLQRDILEEALQTAIAGAELGAAATLRGQMAQVHRAGVDQADDQPGQRLQPRLAEFKVRR
jgi:hypothetical protein